MIINGGSRSNGGFFATHLMRVDHNERVDVRDMRGLAAENVPDALREMAAVACGTRCKNFFYHADINTRADEVLTPEQWNQAVDALERELGLDGQPRFIVEHQKEGRIHQHIVWSRIDAETMTAIPDSHNYRKHEAVARAMEQAFDHTPTPGTLSREYGTERPERCPKDWETFRAQESQIDPKALEAELTALWNHADSGKAFAAAVEAQGYILTRGDRRDFCVIDRAGDEHSLARCLTGVKAAGVRARMGDIDRDALPSVAEGRDLARRNWEDAGGGSGDTAPIIEPEIPVAEREETPLSPFDQVMARTVELARLSLYGPEHEAEIPEPEAAETADKPRSRFEEVMEDQAPRRPYGGRGSGPTGRRAPQGELAALVGQCPPTSRSHAREAERMVAGVFWVRAAARGCAEGIRAMSLEDILAKGGSAKAAAAEMFGELAEPDTYEPYLLRPHAQVAVTLHKANGIRHGFLYHNLRHPRFEPCGDSDLISFTADGLACVIEGKGMGEMFDLLMLQTLLRIREYDGRPPGKLAARITRIEVADAREGEQERPRPYLVK